MAKLLKLRRGTTSQHSSFTGAEGEVTVDTTKDTAVVHDGSTAGGQPLLREDLDNMPASGVSAGTYGSSSAIPAITVNAEGLVTAATTSAIDSTSITNGTSSVSVAQNSNITITRGGTTQANVTSDGIQFPDARKAVFGNSNDLQIYHDATKSYIADAGPGSLRILSDDLRFYNAANNEFMARFQQNGAAELYYDNSKKFETVSNGAKVSGNLTVTNDIYMGGELNLTEGSDGGRVMDVRLGSSSFLLRGTSGGDANHEKLAKFTRNGGCELYHNDSKKFEVVSGGATVTGTLTATTLEGDGVVPAGAIILWSGASNAIPSGYVLCDGTNSTPDLRNRFVVGAGNSYSVGDTGGSTSTTLGTSNLPSHSHSTPNHSHTISGHTHSTPNHSHAVNSHTHSTPNHSHSVNAHSHSTPNHNHNMNNHSHSTNNTGGHSHGITIGNFSSSTDPVHITKDSTSNSQNVNTNSAGNHSHNTNSSRSNTNASGGGNTGNAGANTSTSGGSNTGGSSPNTTTSGGSNTGSTSLTTTTGGGSNTGNTGSGSAIENRPPYYALCYIMKT
ncbi:hypothetical protein STIP37_40 [Synechococcus T7-like phage S-TIP37]|uniref:Major tropism determinant N-terminal domain-containing protein n=1 Tax=Synechococcus T7-like phage S-TIP37 TaxID=1332145 RepID=A0A345AYC0_9CAUD|nr:hypothetical protein HOT80_gp41 [Synechococcus T7-like phage S-TIP37]AXF42100.1 hypothetical protein STIP37_40 [Synechococcus T7-like phage S-TIP37]